MTADSQSDRDPVEVLAAEFVERLRMGEHPSVSEYTSQHPELAEEIEGLFPTIAEMECLKTPSGSSSFRPITTGCAGPERLGDFRIIREIGRGGMGIVYEARQESLGRRVAVKVLPKLAILDPKHLRRFHREASTAAALHHTNIVPVFGVGQHDEYHYYVMQYIDGAGLDRVLARLERSDATSHCNAVTDVVRELASEAATPANTPSVDTLCSDASTPTHRPAAASNEQLHLESCEDLSVIDGRLLSKESSHWHTVANIGVQVADALAYAHGRGVLHRDIKPANLIVDTQGVVWVADFGLAKTFEHDQLSRTGDILGTPAYMAPEQLHGHTDHSTDVYSLGLTLYELLTLREAFPERDRARLFKRIAAEQPTRPRQIRPEIPRELETIVLKAIAPEPERRYQSAAELAADLRRYLTDLPILATRASALERLWLWRRRNPVVASLAATAAFLLLLIAVTASIGYVRTTRALGGERAERQRAEDATQLAVEVLDRIYERFAPDPTVAPHNVNVRDKPALSTATATTLEDMLDFYDRLAQQGEGEGRYIDEIALANRRVGDIRHHLGQLKQAQAAYERALGQYERLQQARPEESYAYERSVVLVEYGIVSSRLFEQDKAVESWKAALATLEAADQTGDSKSKYDDLVARAQSFLSGRGDSRGPPLPTNSSERPFQPPAPNGAPVRFPRAGPPQES